MGRKAASQRQQEEQTANAASEPPERDPAPGDAESTAPTDAGAAGGAEESPEYRALYEQANEKWLRARAEFDNYRKRMQRELAELRDQTKVATVQEFLTFHDHFRMALDHAAQTSDVLALRQGLELICAELGRIFEGLGVMPLEVEGRPFDPEFHEAVAQEPSDAVPAGHVLRQWKAGFVLGDRLVRPAAVVVSAGPAGGPGAAVPQAAGKA